MLDLSDLVVKPVRVEISGVNRDIYVQQLTVAGLGRIGEQPSDTVGRLCYEAELYWCDEHGTPTITTDEDREHLRNLPACVVNAIVFKGREVNSISTTASAQEAEEQAKKESETPTSG